MINKIIFQRSYFEAISDLPLADQSQVYNAVFAYAFNGSETKLEGFSNTVFKLIKSQMDNEQMQNNLQDQINEKKVDNNIQNKRTDAHGGSDVGVGTAPKRETLAQMKKRIEKQMEAQLKKKIRK